MIGGGTGTQNVLRGLRDINVDPTSLMTMADDGGSNQVVRDDFGLLPTSGIRQALVGLSKQDGLLKELFEYRFTKGEGLAGMTFGNVFLIAATDILGSLDAAIRETSGLLSVEGKILPISNDDVRLVATYEDGTEVRGEHHIDEPEHDGKLRIVGLRTEPKATITEDARAAIRSSKVVILGPGDLYTNTVAALVVDGVVDELKQTPAQIAFILNLMTKYGEAYDYTASDYLRDLDHYLPLSEVDVVLVNSDTDFPSEVLQKYHKEQAVPVVDDLDQASLPASTRVIRTPLLSDRIARPQPGDAMKRSMIRHDPERLGEVIMQLINMQG